MATFEDVSRIALAWPGVTVGTWYGTAGLKVGSKGFCRMWSDREHDRDDVHGAEVLVVMCDVHEKQALVDASEGVVFETPHYQGHGGMLLRLGEIDDADLAGFLEDAYRIKATKRLLAEFDDLR